MELRRRKHRDEKPLAVMVEDARAGERLCEINPAELGIARLVAAANCSPAEAGEWPDCARRRAGESVLGCDAALYAAASPALSGNAGRRFLS